MLPWLRLLRLPNVFTAIADVAMGYLFVRGSAQEWRAFACVSAASALLYTAGMVLNDVFDFAIDAKERPFRPLPSGQIRRSTAAIVGWSLLAAGVACGWTAGFWSESAASAPWRSGLLASLLALAIVGYDAILKFTPAGPLGMGVCRWLNVLLGMSAGGAGATSGGFGFGVAELFAAGGIGIYIAGVTWLARNEAGRSQKGTLVASTLVMAAGVAMLGSSVTWRSGAPGRAPIDSTIYWLLLFVLMVPVLRRCAVAVQDPMPQKVQAAVKHSILSLIWLDAATAAAVAGPMYGIAIAALLVPALILGRWVYST